MTTAQETTRYRVGVDIGGTFTDFTAIDQGGGVRLWKEDSTPDDPARAIKVGLGGLADSMGLSEQELLARTDLVVHGTTIATNTLIQRNGPRMGLLSTAGFRDVIYFRDGYKPDRFNLHMPRPDDFVDRYLRKGVTERIGAGGEVVVPLDEGEVRAAAREFAEQGVAAVAVAFLWSHANQAHEHRAAEILADEMPDVHVLCSSDVLPEIREWERTSAAVLGTYVLPRLRSYLGRLTAILAERSLSRAPQIMQNNGGCASVDEVLSRPVNLVASGPAAAPAAAAFYAERIGTSDLISMDMGGTSFDVCVIRRGEPAMSRSFQVEHQPVGVPCVEVHSIGAGGGSIAWIDPGGALRVGPRSAGARPGPACYGAGGELPTVTDANVMLGYLDPVAFLGGRKHLDVGRAEQALQREVADPLGLPVPDAAAGIIKVVDANMLAGIRAVSIERGIDPRGFTLVSGGGAGGLHAARLARALGASRVLVPREASTLCAFGMTVTNVRHDHVQAMFSRSRSLDLDALTALFEELETDARTRLEDEGFAPGDISLERLVDARYVHQIHEMTIAIPSVERYAPEDIDEIERRFHAEHERLCTFALPDDEIELLHWRVTATGYTSRGNGGPPVERPGTAARTHPDGDVPGRTSRQAYFEQAGGFTETDVYVSESLEPGATVSGPAIVAAATTTVVVNPGDTLRVIEGGSMVIDVETGD